MRVNPGFQQENRFGGQQSSALRVLKEFYLQPKVQCPKIINQVERLNKFPNTKDWKISPTTHLCIGCYLMVFSGKIRKKINSNPKSQKLWVEVRKSLKGSSRMITNQIEAREQKVLEGRSWGGDKTQQNTCRDGKLGEN